MFNLSHQYEILSMIDERRLITKKQILEMFNIRNENIERAISREDLSIIRFAGADYFIYEQVALLVENLEENEDD